MMWILPIISLNLSQSLINALPAGLQNRHIEVMDDLKPSISPPVRCLLIINSVYPRQPLGFPNTNRQTRSQTPHTLQYVNLAWR